jgi:hypothetical protein
MRWVNGARLFQIKIGMRALFAIEVGSAISGRYLTAELADAQRGWRNEGSEQSEWQLHRTEQMISYSSFSAKFCEFFGLFSRQ